MAPLSLTLTASNPSSSGYLVACASLPTWEVCDLVGYRRKGISPLPIPVCRVITNASS